jgi:hypothetical protein
VNVLKPWPRTTAAAKTLVSAVTEGWLGGWFYTMAHEMEVVSIMKRLDPLGLKCDTITSPRRLVTTFITSNSYRV